MDYHFSLTLCQQFRKSITKCCKRITDMEIKNMKIHKTLKLKELSASWAFVGWWLTSKFLWWSVSGDVGKVKLTSSLTPSLFDVGKQLSYPFITVYTLWSFFVWTRIVGHGRSHSGRNVLWLIDRSVKRIWCGSEEYWDDFKVSPVLHFENLLWIFLCCILIMEFVFTVFKSAWCHY